MNIGVWNVRGLNDPLKQKDIVGRLKRLKCNLVCLIETRVKESKCQTIVDKVFPGWGQLQNYSSAVNGRIWILWSSLVQVREINTMEQCITCLVSIQAKQFWLSVVYGLNRGIERRRLWDHLCSLGRNMNQKPWMIAGDFNSIVNPSESSSVNSNQVMTTDTKEFKECLQKLEVFDHVYSGPLFTWTNRQREGFVAKKLDRVLINGNWLLSFPSSKVEFLPLDLLTTALQKSS